MIIFVKDGCTESKYLLGSLSIILIFLPTKMPYDVQILQNNLASCKIRDKLSTGSSQQSKHDDHHSDVPTCLQRYSPDHHHHPGSTRQNIVANPSNTGSRQFGDRCSENESKNN